MYIFISFISLIFCEIDIVYEKSDAFLKIEEDVIEHQICSGYFEAKNNINCSYEVSITTREGRQFLFYKEQIGTDKTHFSFNTTKPQKLIVEIRPVVLDKSLDYFTSLVTYHFDSQFDTFNKEVAKGVKIEPAVQALTSLEKLLYEIYLKTEARAEGLRNLHTQHSKVIRFVVGISMVTLSFVIGFNVYQVYSMKQFFKKKKLI